LWGAGGGRSVMNSISLTIPSFPGSPAPGQTGDAPDSTADSAAARKEFPRLMGKRSQAAISRGEGAASIPTTTLPGRGSAQTYRQRTCTRLSFEGDEYSTPERSEAGRVGRGRLKTLLEQQGDAQRKTRRGARRRQAKAERINFRRFLYWLVMGRQKKVVLRLWSSGLSWCRPYRDRILLRQIAGSIKEISPPVPGAEISGGMDGFLVGIGRLGKTVSAGRARPQVNTALKSAGASLMAFSILRFSACGRPRLIVAIPRCGCG